MHRIIPFLILLLLSTPAMASVSLGEIEVRSYLNQPLQAQISIQGSALTDDRLEVRLASEETYRRAGLARGAVPADLTIQLEGTGTSRIVRLATQRPVREPYVGLLLEARWGAGRVLREYTILLDPPVAFAPERSVAPVISRSPELAPRATPTPTARTEFGPRPVEGAYTVRPGDGLAAIVRRQGYADVTAEQAMLAILEANPRAFIGGNVNLLLAGAQLAMPSEEEVAHLSLQDARQEIQRQTAEWRDRTAPPSPPPTPSRVAEAAPPEDVVPETEPDPPEDVAPETEPDPAPTPEQPEPAAPSDDLEDEAAATVLGGAEPATTDRLEILSELDHGLGAGDGASAQVMEEALLSQQTAMSELREELISLRSELTERDQMISVVNAELAQLEERMRELQEQREAGSLGGTSGMAMHERILADPLLLLLAATSLLLFLLLLVSLFRPVRSQPAVTEPRSARRDPEPPRVVPAALAAEPVVGAPDPIPSTGATAATPVGAGAAAAGAAAALGAATKGGKPETTKPSGDIDVGENGEDDVLADIDLYLAYGMNEQAISALEGAIRDGRDHPEYRIRLIEAYAASDDGEGVRSNAAALRERLGPEDDALRERIAAAEAGVSASGDGAGATGADANSLDFVAVDAPEWRTGDDASGSGTAETGQEDANLLRFDLDDVDDGAERGAILEASDTSESVSGGEQDDLPMLELPDFETGDETGPSGGLQGAGDSDTSENGMKLSLAEAFVEMGDPEGALALLDEIKLSATAEQAAKVEQLRKQIGDTAD